LDLVRGRVKLPSMLRLRAPHVVFLLAVLLAASALRTAANPPAAGPAVAPAPAATAPVAPEPPRTPAERWAKELAAFDAADAATPPPAAPIVFTGSSSIRLWKDLDTDFPGRRVLNRGFGGSRLDELVALYDRVILRYRPRQVVIYSGANDINAGRTPDAVLADLETLVGLIRRDLPDTRVVFLSLALNPRRWEQRDRIREVNRRAEALLAKDPRSRFLDVTSAMVGADGLPKPDIFVEDQLHMNRKGYELWAPLVGAVLVP
jgi:lysophospholipase L1-like esterase